jgi:beta-N-acetylhexosaminidase
VLRGFRLLITAVVVTAVVAGVGVAVSPPDTLETAVSPAVVTTATMTLADAATDTLHRAAPLSRDDDRARAALEQRRPTPAERVLSRMNLRQRVGQLFMVGTPATRADDRVLRAIRHRHLGNVMLTGRSHEGVRHTARVSARLQSRTTLAATRRVGLLVATDQEGGLVQVLQGPGFDTIPTALTQGGWALGRLHDRAARWGAQLHRAGVSMNLAPVVDTVPSPRAARHNPPIGFYDREFGYTTRVVARHGRAFLRGMHGRGVVPTAKHFPGLGRVHANTDTTSGVTDTVTRRHDPYLRPFATAVRAGVPAVMMSTAIYRRIDRGTPAAFSHRIVTGMLRGDLGFRRVVVSDDLGQAAQVSLWSPGARAVKFLRAGGDLVLTVDPGTLPAMYGAVLDRAQHSDAFRDRIRDSALRVLTLKQREGLL